MDIHPAHSSNSSLQMSWFPLSPSSTLFHHRLPWLLTLTHFVLFIGCFNFLFESLFIILQFPSKTSSWRDYPKFKWISKLTDILAPIASWRPNNDNSSDWLLSLLTEWLTQLRNQIVQRGLWVREYKFFLKSLEQLKHTFFPTVLLSCLHIFDFVFFLHSF